MLHVFSVLIVSFIASVQMGPHVLLTCPIVNILLQITSHGPLLQGVHGRERQSILCIKYTKQNDVCTSTCHNVFK